jgi:uncharacterized protein (TIGR03435 family)
MSGHHAFGVTFATLAVAVSVHAQETERPAFEVASIKVNRTGMRGDPPMARFLPGGRWTVTNLTLRNLVLNSHRLQEFQLTGGPSWVSSDRFDIAATAGRDASPDELRLMVRTLLAERFKLVTHTERQERPAFDLMIARADGRLGPGLRTTAADCITFRAPVAPPSPNEPLPQCGFLGQGSANVFFRGVPIEAFARSTLTMRLGRMVVDRTQLSGNFDIDLEWTPGPEEIGPPPPPDANRSAADGPSLFTALQEQLGLKLESSRALIEVLVIDGATRPSEN